MDAGGLSRMVLLRGSRPLAGDRAGGLIVGGDYVGLGVARSLGRAGVPVGVLDDERSITRFSRFTDFAARVPDLRDEEACAAALLALGRRLDLDGWVLYPTRDEIVSAISRHRDRLQDIYRVPTPPWEVVRWAADKRYTYQLAERVGVPTPRTWYPRSVEGLGDIDGAPPFAVKPAIKENFIYETGDKAWRADSRQELERLFRRASDILGPGHVMVQELIPGDGRYQYGFGTFFKHAASVGSMVARRRRQHPHEFGRATTYAETVDIPVLEERSQRLLATVEYYGLAEVEYKQDPRDGEYKLLDFNARAWGYHSLGAEAGVDFPLLLFEDQLGRPGMAGRARPGVRWTRLTTDLPTAAVDVLAGRLRPRDALRSWFRDADTEAVFSLRDPGPGMAEAALLPYLVVRRGF